MLYLTLSLVGQVLVWSPSFNYEANIKELIFVLVTSKIIWTFGRKLREAKHLKVTIVKLTGGIASINSWNSETVSWNC